MIDKSSSSDNLPSSRPQPSHPPGGLSVHLATGLKRPGHIGLGAGSPGTPSAIRHFNLKEIGIDLDAFVRSLSASYDSLPLDEYEQRQQQIAYLLEKLPNEREKIVRISPDFFSGRMKLQSFGDLLAKLSPKDQHDLQQLGTFKRRAVARFEALFYISRFPEIRRVDCGSVICKSGVSQNLSHLPRTYPEILDKVTEQGSIKQLCRIAALMAKGLNKGIFGLSITMQQVSIVLQKNLSGGIPETLDQHGVDYIVPAIPIILENMNVPMNTVYEASEKPVYKSRLKVGDGLFLDDRMFRHSIASPKATAQLGRQCFLTLDIQVTALEISH